MKGYEWEKGKWIVLMEEDFDQVSVASTHTIEISDFVASEEINPKYFHTPYLLEALKGGEKGYPLLHRALFETGKVGIAKVAIRSREYLAAVKPDGLFLMLDLMHFAGEVLEPEGLKAAGGKEVSPRELEMAKQLIESMGGPWEPEKYKDEYRDALMRMIEAKAKHLPTAAKPSRPLNQGDVLDLVAVLQESLSKAGAKKGKEASAGTGRPRGAAKTTALVKGKRATGIKPG